MEDVSNQLAVTPPPPPPPLAHPASPSAATGAAEADAAAAAVVQAEGAAAAEGAAVDMSTRSKWTFALRRAASRGQLRVFHKALLHMNPELAEARDSQQRSPLHLAAANGHTEVVKKLTEVRPEMCLARDQDGANPLHLAAMRGKVEVLDELYKANPHAARARVDSGERETILHLCVKYDQPQFLEKLLEKFLKGEEFVNAKDNAGNTILHLAVADRRLEIVNNVLRDTKIDFRAKNASNQTAMDILLRGRKKGSELEGVDGDIQSLLGLYCTKREFELVPVEPSVLAEMRNGIIVAAALVATLAFQAAVAPPGGVWQDNNDGHTSGKSVMAFNQPVLYLLFAIFNSVSFVSSLLTVYLMSMNPMRKSFFDVALAMAAMFSTIGSITGTYVISLIMVSSKLDRMSCVGKEHTPTCKSLLHASTTLEIISSILAAASLLWIMIRIILRKRKIRRYEERVNRAGLANPAPVGEANA